VISSGRNQHGQTVNEYALFIYLFIILKHIIIIIITMLSPHKEEARRVYPKKLSSKVETRMLPYRGIDDVLHFSHLLLIDFKILTVFS
jgi:short subunit fatty acids transporter